MLFRSDEPFNFMNDIRRHGMDVVLTLTIDPSLKEADILELAKDLRPYGRVLLRVNHECTGSWFCYTKRASYQQIADFFVMVCRVMHEHAPNVKMILCAGLFDDSTGKIEMEDIFLEAHKAADIWSGDNYPLQAAGTAFRIVLHTLHSVAPLLMVVIAVDHADAQLLCIAATFFFPDFIFFRRKNIGIIIIDHRSVVIV